MKYLPRALFITGSLFLLLLFTAPIWSITLHAPQYPDGVRMYIYINKIGGSTPGTLQNINILNHYVGMKKIVPEMIPELNYFPLVVIAMLLIGVLLGVFNLKKLWVYWVAGMIILGALGIYDFYLWEYDYGHNLLGDAPIKIPGQVYQPPLFGAKQLLNFNAKSYPYIGGIYLGISLALCSLAYFLNFKKEKEQTSDSGQEISEVTSKELCSSQMELETHVH